MPTLRERFDAHITLHSHDSPREEFWNGLTHAAGVLLAVAGLVFMVLRARTGGRPLIVAGAAVFGCNMIFLYLFSSLYHFTPASTVKRVFRVLDHSNIFFLIAGTYTPLCLLIGPPTGIFLLVLVWIIALAGAAVSFVFWGRFRGLKLALYLAMGWLIVLFWRDVRPVMAPGLVAWIVAGGLTYTTGVLFYRWKNLPYHHAVWHLFVLGGSLCFYLGIYGYALS